MATSINNGDSVDNRVPVLVSRVSQLSGKTHTLRIVVDVAKLEQYMYGQSRGLIQQEFPYLSPAEREFLMTGITAEEWDGAFKDE